MHSSNEALSKVIKSQSIKQYACAFLGAFSKSPYSPKDAPLSRSANTNTSSSSISCYSSSLLLEFLIDDNDYNLFFCI